LNFFKAILSKNPLVLQASAFCCACVGVVVIYYFFIGVAYNEVNLVYGDEQIILQGSSETFGELLDEESIPIYKPTGGHAVYIMADKFLSHIPREHFPGWALTVALYREGGVRGVEIGGVMFAKKDEKTGREKFPKLEMVRLSIPRRVYTLSHINYVVGVLSELYKKREKIRGLKIVEEEPPLRHFTARLEEI